VTIFRFVPLLALLATAPKPAAPGSPGGPGLVDLAAPWGWTLPSTGAALPAEALAAEAAREILAAPALGEDAAAQLPSALIQGIEAAKRAEGPLLRAEKGSVRRDGKRLVITPRSGRPVLFQDQRVPETRTADGDRTDYAYTGRLGIGSLHRVETSFGHDAPGSYLVSPADGRTIFVHEGSDHVVLSPGKERLVVFNDLNGPLTVALVSLGAGGPALEAVCRAGTDGRSSAELKGWKSSETVDLVLLLGERGHEERIPVRLSRQGSAWRVAAPDASRVTATFRCVDGLQVPGA